MVLGQPQPIHLSENIYFFHIAPNTMNIIKISCRKFKRQEFKNSDCICKYLITIISCFPGRYFFKHSHY